MQLVEILHGKLNKHTIICLVKLQAFVKTKRKCKDLDTFCVAIPIRVRFTGVAVQHAYILSPQITKFTINIRVVKNSY